MHERRSGLLYGLFDIGLKAKQLGWRSTKPHATWQMTLCLMCLVVLAGCRPSVEDRGSTVPRNAREQVIFDYFHALREQRYEDAYQLRALHLSSPPPSPKDFLYFKKTHQERYESLATQIAVGEEERWYGDGPCSYIYTVYAVEPDHNTLVSGMVSLHSKSDQPEVCLMGYYSAFGFFP